MRRDEPDGWGELGLRMVLRAPDGTEQDITEGVRALYDLVTSSMDWGSGFWTYEDAVPVAVLAEACRFPDMEGTREYVEAQRFSEEQQRFLAGRDLSRYSWPSAHDHVFASRGRCMWPNCHAREEVG